MLQVFLLLPITMVHLLLITSKVLKEIREILVLLVLKDQKVTQATQVLRVFKVSKVSKVLKVTKAIKVTLVRLVHRGLRATLVKLGLKVQKVMPLLMQTLPQNSLPL